jgi:GTP-binding protein
MLISRRAEHKHSTFSVLDLPLVVWWSSTLRDMVPGADPSGVPFSTIISKLGSSKFSMPFHVHLTPCYRLCRVFILISAAHGITVTDEAMLSSLSAQIQSVDSTCWTLQAIITRADALKTNGRAQIDQIGQDIFRIAPTCLPPIITSCPSKGIAFGIDEVRKSISHACGILP